MAPPRKGWVNGPSKKPRASKRDGLVLFEKIWNSEEVGFADKEEQRIPNNLCRGLSILLCPIPQEVIQLAERPSLETLAMERRFLDIVRILSDDRIDSAEWLFPSTVSRRSGKFSPRSTGGESPLHILVKYQPPLHVVSLLIRMLRELTRGACLPEAEQDRKGRTPLHVACAFGCSIAVVARLVDGDTASHANPASVRDSAHMLPLHWACTAAHAVAAHSDSRANMVHLVGFLVEAYPHGVFMENGRGLTPIDLGRQRRVHPAILQVLCRSARRQLEQSRTGGPDWADSWVPNNISFLTDRDDVSSVGSQRDHSGCGSGPDLQSQAQSDLAREQVSAVMDDRLEQFETLATLHPNHGKWSRNQQESQSTITVTCSSDQSNVGQKDCGNIVKKEYYAQLVISTSSRDWIGDMLRQDIVRKTLERTVPPSATASSRRSLDFLKGTPLRCSHSCF